MIKILIICKHLWKIQFLTTTLRACMKACIKNRLSLCWIAFLINHLSPLCPDNLSYKSDSPWELRVCVINKITPVFWLMKWGSFIVLSGHQTQQGLYPTWPCLMEPSLVFYTEAQKQPASFFFLWYHSLIKVGCDLYRTSKEKVHFNLGT